MMSSYRSRNPYSAAVNVASLSRPAIGIAKGRKAIAEDLAKKMAERSANAAIYLSRTQAGLAREIGDWSEGESELGPWVATAQDHLLTAIRFLVAMQRLRSLRSDCPTFDAAMFENQIERIRTSLKRIQSINRKVTNARDSVDEISTEAIALRDEIRDALVNIRTPSAKRNRPPSNSPLLWPGVRGHAGRNYQPLEPGPLLCKLNVANLVKSQTSLSACRRSSRN